MKQQAVLVLFTISTLFSCTQANEEVNACDNNFRITAAEVFEAVENDPIGRIIAEVSGGAAPYTFSINNGSFGNISEFQNLPAGSYVLKAQDKNGCTAEVNTVVTEQLIVSYEAQIKPILITNCMIEGCHCTGNPLCFSTYEEVLDKAEGIRNRTTNKAMPPANSGKMLNDTEIRQIANWVYQGTKNN